MIYGYYPMGGLECPTSISYRKPMRCCSKAHRYTHQFLRRPAYLHYSSLIYSTSLQASMHRSLRRRRHGRIEHIAKISQQFIQPVLIRDRLASPYLDRPLRYYQDQSTKLSLPWNPTEMVDLGPYSVCNSRYVVGPTYKHPSRVPWKLFAKPSRRMKNRQL